MKSLKMFGMALLVLVMMFGITGCFEVDEDPIYYAYTLSTETGSSSPVEVEIYDGTFTIGDYGVDTPVATETFSDDTTGYAVFHDFEEGLDYTVLCYYDDDVSGDLNTDDLYVIIPVNLLADDSYEIPDTDWLTML